MNCFWWTLTAFYCIIYCHFHLVNKGWKSQISSVPVSGLCIVKLKYLLLTETCRCAWEISIYICFVCDHTLKLRSFVYHLCVREKREEDVILFWLAQFWSNTIKVNEIIKANQTQALLSRENWEQLYRWKQVPPTCKGRKVIRMTGTSDSFSNYILFGLKGTKSWQGPQWKMKIYHTVRILFQSKVAHITVV